MGQDYRRHVVEQSVKVRERGGKLVEVTREAAIDDRDSALDVEQVPAHPVRAEPVDAVRDLFDGGHCTRSPVAAGCTEPDTCRLAGHFVCRRTRNALSAWRAEQPIVGFPAVRARLQNSSRCRRALYPSGASRVKIVAWGRAGRVDAAPRHTPAYVGDCSRQV
jgi:hypothetical protein